MLKPIPNFREQPTVKYIALDGPSPAARLLAGALASMCVDVVDVGPTAEDPNPENIPADTPVWIVISWQDLVDAEVDRVVAAIAARASQWCVRSGSRGRITLCTIPYASFVRGEDVLEEYPVRRLDRPVASAFEAAVRLREILGPEADCTLVSLPMLLAPAAPTPGYASLAGRIMGAVHALRLEVDDKVPRYFDRYPLQCEVAPGTMCNAISPDTAAELLLGIGTRRPQNRRLLITNGISWDSFFELMAAESRTPIVRRQTQAPATALDNVFNQIIKLSGGLRVVQHSHSAADCEVIPAASGLCDAVHAVAARPLAEWETTYVAVTQLEWCRVPGVQFQPGNGTIPAYYVSGSGPVVVLIPPLGTDARSCVMLTAELVRDHRVIVWEPAASPVTQGEFAGFQPGDQSERIVELMDAQGVSQCHVVAWCSGSHVASALAARWPDRIASLCLLTPGVFELRNATNEYKSLVSFYTRLVENPSGVTHILNHTRASIAGKPSQNLEQYVPRDGPRSSPLQTNGAGYHLIGEVLDDPNRALAWARQSLRNLACSESVTRELQQCPLPILAVLGTQDALVDFASVRERCREFQRWTIATIVGGNHFVLVEHAPVIADLLRLWIRTGRLECYDGGAVHAGRLVIESYASGIHAVQQH